jgi:hypothetical protein
MSKKILCRWLALAMALPVAIVLVIGCDAAKTSPPTAALNASPSPGQAAPASVASQAAVSIPNEAGSEPAPVGKADAPPSNDTSAATIVERVPEAEVGNERPQVVEPPVTEELAPLRTVDPVDGATNTQSIVEEPPVEKAEQPKEPEAKDDKPDHADSLHARLHAGEPPFDPIEANGKYFEDWPKPKAVLVITGRQDGYLEPCGCAGLENMKGGMSRRHVFLKELAERGWPAAAVDVGGLVRRFGKQAEFQFATSADGLKEMGYGAVGFGPADLRLSAGDVVAAIAGAKQNDSIFVSANVNLFDVTPRARVIQVGSMKIGVTSVLGKKYAEQVNNGEVQIKPAAAALKEVMPELRNCDVRVLLAHATEEECQALAAQFPAFDLVVTADVSDIPPAQPPKLPGGKSYYIDVGHKGMYAVVAGFFGDPAQGVRFQRVALDSRFGDSKPMKQLMADYQGQLAQLGWDGLGLRRSAAPQAQRGDALAGKFVGAASCKDCHPNEHEVWANSKHAHATETLVKLDPPRQFDAECISCHAVGWNPQENLPYATGFESVEKTPHLTGNSCENCHGPAAAHVAAEKGKNAAKRDAAREALKISWPAAKENVCKKCHDHDNSPDFETHADAYWSEIEH